MPVFSKIKNLYNFKPLLFKHYFIIPIFTDQMYDRAGLVFKNAADRWNFMNT